MTAPAPAEVPLDGDGWRFRGFLGDGWRWARLGEPQPAWLPGRVPGSVVDDLRRAGELPDPQVGRNSLAAEWVATRHWAYVRTFKADPAWRPGRVELRFEGLDPAARLFLNGRPLGRHAGMFVPASREIGARLRDGENVLAVVLEPAPESEPQVGDTRRVRVHRSRMAYGWDFCPRLLHQGIWDAVALRVTGPVRLDDLWIRPTLAADGSARIAARAQLDVAELATVGARLELTLDGSRVGGASTTATAPIGRSALELGFELPDAGRWWPNGAGDQPLYRARVELSADGELSDVRETSFGIRSVEWLPNEGAPSGAAPHTLRVNGRRTWIRGWNWVPVDLSYGVPHRERAEHLVDLARRAGANLLRVWGGGLIEREAFYAACDRAGIMVWQEFAQSSSGIVSQPSRAPSWRRLLEREAAAIVPRRRNHPSLVAWCGGNELALPDGTPCDDGEPALAALGEVVRELDPDRAWFPTSPTGTGELHGPWEHQGLGRHEAHHDALAPTLHSEFGVEGAATAATIEATVPAGRREPIDRANPEWAHRGEWWINVPLLRATFGDAIDGEDLLRASRYLQASGLAYAVDANARRAWRTSGALPWQLNEPFANAFCTSAVDGYGRPKPAWAAVAESYRDLALSARFPTQAWGGRARFEAEVWVASRLPRPLEGELRVAGATMDGVPLADERRTVRVPADASARLGEAAWALDDVGNAPFLLLLSLADGDGVQVADRRYLFSAGVDLGSLLRQPPTDVAAERDGDGADTWRLRLHNRGSHAALLLRIEDARPIPAPGWAIPAEDLVTLLPGEERTLAVAWRDVPPAERRLTVRGWNTAEIVVG
ncbi:MAG TPA: glycoside hydrolase family 2 TIM barrel-domain containing protein [Candidatus Limnocylindria bacterium]|nr:glycoside hydrolase family 2 TIM barrel-domain containing protein [Candidatus Limnocylindria bacterium]